MPYRSLIAWTLLAAACVDPRAEFDDFATRGIDGGADPTGPRPDGAPVEELPELDGEFYIVAKLAVPSVDDKLVHFRVTVDYEPITANTGTLDWSAQPLDFRTLEPVGAPLVATDAPVGSDGASDVPFVGILPARANPVTQTDVELDAVVHNQIRSADFLCGDITGTGGATSLDGTTFGGQRITGALPPPIVRCEDGP